MTAGILPGAERLPTMEGARVRLRWLEPGDAPALLAIFGDAQVVRYMNVPLLADAGAAAHFLADVYRLFAERTLFQWGVARREDDAVVGTFTLVAPDEHGVASLGYAVARAHWGRGYAGESLALAIRFAFEVLGVRRLEADADPRNEPSLRALARQGFRREGYQRARYVQLGEVQDAVLVGLLREEWTASAGAQV